MKLWPQGFIILLFPLLCLLLMKQNRTSPLWLSIALGLVAGLTAQLHFTGFLLVAGLALAALLAGGWPGAQSGRARRLRHFCLPGLPTWRF